MRRTFRSKSISFIITLASLFTLAYIFDIDIMKKMRAIQINKKRTIV